jgi:hypothetical protein
MCRCLLSVLCPVRRPITTLDCALLKDINAVLAAVLGPEINSWACLIVPASPRHRTKCCLFIQHWIFLLMHCLETPTAGSGPTKWWAESSFASSSAISFPRIPDTGRETADITLYPCLEEYSNPRPECSSSVIPSATQPLWSPHFRTPFLCVLYENRKFSSKFFRFSRRLFPINNTQTKCTLLFPDISHYSITLKTPTRFDPLWGHHQGIGSKQHRIIPTTSAQSKKV